MKNDLDEPVHLVEYDSNWTELFREESGRLCKVAPFILAAEHFGSTAIQGMAAKPIVDILIGVKELPVVAHDIQQLQQAGYEYLGEAGVPGRSYFRKRGIQNFNLAIVVLGGHHWKDNLLLREYLRSNPAAAAEYEREKRRAVANGATMLLAYSQAKGDCISRLLARARTWQTSIQAAM